MLIVLRKISFYFAIVGMIATVLLVIKMRPNYPAAPPPVAPATKPTPHAIAAAGLVEARHENTNIGVPAAALLRRIDVKVWDAVKAGDVLFVLDDRDLRAQLLTNRANVAVAEAAFGQVNSKFKRVEKLTAGQVSSEDWQERKDNVVLAQAQLDYARAAVEQTQALLDRLTVRSPIDGTVLQVNVRAGEYVQPGQAAAPVVLGNTAELQLRADVDEQLAPRVRPGEDAVGYVKGDSANPIRLTFVRVEPFVIPKRSLTGSSGERVDTRVLQVIFAFKNPADRSVYVGQQMDVYLDGSPLATK